MVHRDSQRALLERVPASRIDTQPTKLQEYLTTLHATEQRLQVSERVERPMSSSPPRNMTGVGMRHVSTISAATPTEAVDGSDCAPTAQHHAHSMLDSFRGELERRNAARRDLELRRFLVDHRQTQTAGLANPDRAIPGWSSTALAGEGIAATGRMRGVGQHPQPSLPGRPLGGIAPQHSVEDEALELRTELLLARRELFAERQLAVITHESYQRDALDAERAHRLRMWSQHLSLLIQLKTKKAMLRPSQIYLESLREKDAAQIRLLRDRVDHLTAVVASRPQHAALLDAPTDEQPTDDERREWNELYRNLLDRIEAQRHAIDAKNALITRLQTAAVSSTPAPQHVPVWGHSASLHDNAQRQRIEVHRDVDSPPQCGGMQSEQ